jgi:predicted ATPase
MGKENVTHNRYQCSEILELYNDQIFSLLASVLNVFNLEKKHTLYSFKWRAALLKLQTIRLARLLFGFESALHVQAGTTSPSSVSLHVMATKV